MTETGQGEEDSILRKLCDEHGFSVRLAQELLEIEREYQTSQRRHGIYDRLKEVIEESVSERQSQPRA